MEYGDEFNDDEERNYKQEKLQAKKAAHPTKANKGILKNAAKE